MNIRNPKTIPPVKSEHSATNCEIIHEMFGTAVGGSHAHSLAQIAIPPGKASRKHYHPVAEESYTVLSGTARMEMDGETAVLNSGDSVIILPPQVHQIFNAGENDLVLLVVCAPAWTPSNSVFLD